MDNAAQSIIDSQRAEIAALERKLDAARLRYNALFATTAEGLVVVDDAGIYIEVNEAYARLLKSVPSALTGKHFSNFIPPERVAEAEATFAALSQGGPHIPEFPLLAVDGTIVDCEWTVAYHFLPGLTLGSARDITNRKRHQAALETSEARFRTAVNAVSSLLWTNDSDGRMTGHQPGWSAFTGQSDDEYQGFGWSNAVHPDDAQPTLNAWNNAVANRAMFVFEHRVRRHDGVYRTFAIRALPVWNDNGIVTEWVGVHTDITEERQLNEALRESESRLRLAQAAAEIGIWDWDLGTNKITWSPEIYRITGIPAGTAPSVPIWLDRIHPEDREYANAALQRALAHGESLEVAFRFVHYDGNIRWILSRARIFRDAPGRAIRVLGLNMDITAQKRVEQRTTFLLRLEDAIRPLTESRAITQAAATLLGEHLAAARCTYAEVESDSDTFRITGGYSDSAESVVGRHRFSDYGPEYLRLMRQGDPYILEDAATDPRAQQHRGAYKRSGISAIVCVPLLKDGRLAAAMALQQPSPRVWLDDEIELLQLVASRCWESLERSRTQTELRRQRQLRDALLANIPDLICTLGEDGRFTYANPALLALWQKSLGEIVGKNTFDLGYPPDLAARIQSEVQLVVASKRSMRNHTPYMDPSGRTRIYEYIFSPVLSSSGALEAVTCTARDVSDRERMEQVLAESKHRLQHIFAQAPVAIIVFRGRDLIVDLANPSFHALVQNRELLGRPLADIVPELGSDVFDTFHHVFDTGEPFVGNELHIPYDQDGDGRIEDHWFNVVYHPLRESGAVSGVVAVCSEVTQQVLARQALERANRELEEFAYVASHDLQEPLRMIGIFTQLLIARHIGGNPQAAEYAGHIRDGVLRMDKLIRDLLSYSRIIHTTPPPPGVADCNEAFAQAIGTLNGCIKDTNAELVVGPLPRVRGEERQLELVFQNLLSNSLKYRRDSAPPRIEISAERQDEFWKITVRDNGIGFDQQYAERIFGLFKRLHSQEYPGTGLGLAICQRIVERYGGRIWAEGRENEGAAFYLLLHAEDSRQGIEAVTRIGGR